VVALLAAFYSPVKVKTFFPSRCRTMLESSLSPIDNFPQSMTPFNMLNITDFDQLQDLVEND
jgi:hypothetical protein